MRENSTVLAPYYCMSEHPHVRLDQSGSVVGREEFKTERSVKVFYYGPGILPDQVVAAAGVPGDETTVAGKLRGADLLGRGGAEVGDKLVFAARCRRLVADGQRRDRVSPAMEQLLE